MARKKFHVEGTNINEFLNKGAAYVSNVGTMPVSVDLRLHRLPGRFKEVCDDGAERFCCKIPCEQCKVKKRFETVRSDLIAERGPVIQIAPIIQNCSDCTINLTVNVHVGGKTWDLFSGEEV